MFGSKCDAAALKLDSLRPLVGVAAGKALVFNCIAAFRHPAASCSTACWGASSWQSSSLTATSIYPTVTPGASTGKSRWATFFFFCSFHLVRPMSFSLCSVMCHSTVPPFPLTVPLLQGHAAWPLLVRRRARRAHAFTCQRRRYFTMRWGVRGASDGPLSAQRRRRRRWRSRSTDRGSGFRMF